MKKVTPYKSYRYALASLDNGGRFYNLISKAKDGDISSAELAKAAGITSGSQQMILYLEMSLCSLAADVKEKVLTHLSADLKAEYQKHKPTNYSPEDARHSAKATTTAMVTGVPKLVDAKTEFVGFVMVPIVSRTTTTFSMIPILDTYDVYELRDVNSDEQYFIAHGRRRQKLPEVLTRCGGVIKELKTKGKPNTTFLEMSYYTPLTD